MSEFQSGILLGCVITLFAVFAIGGLLLLNQDLHTCPDGCEGESGE